MASFDHLAYCASDLAQGVALAERALGVGFAAGGKHELMATHNRLLGLDDLYLEVIAIDPDAAPAERARWFDLDRFQGELRLTNWVVRCEDLDAALAICPPGMGTLLQLTRGPYRWRMAVPDNGQLPFDGCFPALIEWQGSAHPTQALPASGLRLERLDIGHPQAEALKLALAPLVQDPRVFVSAAPQKQMMARFDGPGGALWLG